MAANLFDQLVDACREAETWPKNLIRKQQLNCVLQNYQDQFDEDQGRLFSENRMHVNCWEAPAGGNDFEHTKLKSFTALQQSLSRHLSHRHKDPWSRHVFLSAAHSRAQLNCTAQAFRLICSYQQIPPVITDVMTSFGKQHRPIDFHSASFSQDDLCRPVRGLHMAITEIGRSGWELRHCYKLHGLEKSNYDNNWTMRQTATYHSFDMIEGRAFWLTIKASNVVRDRIMDGSKSLEAMQAARLGDLGSSFIACLATHLVTVDWCAEGWKWRINEIEQQTRELLIRVRAIPLEPVAAELDFKPEQLVHSLSMRAGPTTGPTQSSTRATTNTLKRTPWKFPSLPSFMRSKSAPPATTVELQQVCIDTPSNNPHISAAGEKQDRILKSLERLKTFSFAEFRDLCSTSMKLEELKLAMEQDVRVLQELREYYQRRCESSQLPREIRDACASTGFFDHFVQRVQAVQSRLEAECSRIATLVVLIEDGKRLYDSILQSYNTGVNSFFTINSQMASKRMEDVTESMYYMAVQTARDSASMHMITFITLLLLPGTFLATFFSTPFIDDNSGAVDNGFLLFFLELCIPSTLLTFLVWRLFMVYVQRKSPQQ